MQPRDFLLPKQVCIIMKVVSYNLVNKYTQHKLLVYWNLENPN